MYVNRVGVFDEDGRVVFVKLGFVGGGFCSSLDGYDGSFNVFGAWRTDGC